MKQTGFHLEDNEVIINHRPNSSPTTMQHHVLHHVVLARISSLTTVPPWRIQIGEKPGEVSSKNISCVLRACWVDNWKRISHTKPAKHGRVKDTKAYQKLEVLFQHQVHLFIVHSSPIHPCFFLGGPVKQPNTAAEIVETIAAANELLRKITVRITFHLGQGGITYAIWIRQLQIQLINKMVGNHLEAILRILNHHNEKKSK